MSKIQMGGWFEEEYLLRHDKYSSNMYSSNQGGLPRSSSDKDVHHKRIRMMGTHKYLRKAATTALNALQLLFWPHLC